MFANNVCAFRNFSANIRSSDDRLFLTKRRGKKVNKLLLPAVVLRHLDEKRVTITRNIRVNIIPVI